ncbi:MAG: TerB family tellurite resistance protein [Alphaproteobacteria bacterium]|nr:TerB family tellurite resistance protein [Alphaproteobacteria bacterium]
MLDGLRQFIVEMVSSRQHSGFGESDYRLAATALLIHVMALDGTPSEPGKRKLHGLIRRQFSLDTEAADELIQSAMALEGDAVDLDELTGVIVRSLDETGRKRIVTMMWEMVFVDGKVSEFEDSVVWRACDLLGVSPHDRDGLKRDVELGHGHRPGHPPVA